MAGPGKRARTEPCFTTERDVPRSPAGLGKRIKSPGRSSDNRLDMDAQPKEGAPEARPRILVVDDESDLVSVLRFGLEVEGFEVIDAADGEEGLRLAREGQPHLMLLDLMLPKMDGYKVCRALKFDDRYKALPIFILSARSGEQDRKLAFEMGADAFVTKPYDMKDLVAKIRAKLGLPTNRQAA